jgi:hypothetical protein
MFRRKDPQGSLFEASHLFPEEKRERLRGTWAHMFRTHALPLIDENLFRDLFCSDNGRPNKPVSIVVGALILKDMMDLTDEETLYRLDFDMGWHHALGLQPEEAQCCQKTLHNFRVKLLAHERAPLLFTDMTDKILAALGLNTAKQRLDSTHIVSNMAVLTRLGLFCETLRVFLRELRRTLPDQWAGLPVGLRRRYLKDDGSDTGYDDAKAQEARRRLPVCARDLWRLCQRFRGTGPAAQLESYGLLQRLFADQCELTDAPVSPAADDADRGDEAVPVQVKEPRQVSADSLQSPHDPDATYGHKGKGYEVQLAETCGNGAKPEIITYVDVTASAGSDATQTVPVVEALAERGIQPKELLADTTYGGMDNVITCAAKGTELLSPVAGPKVPVAAPSVSVAETALAAAPSVSVAETALAAATAAGQPSVTAAPVSAATTTTPATPAPARPATPAETKAKLLQERRRYEATAAFRERYAERAGIEGSNSEMKRKHGLGKLRVRTDPRVRLAVFFKTLACNVKRMLGYLLDQVRAQPTATDGEMAAAMA